MKPALNLHLCLKSRVAALILAGGYATAYARAPTACKTGADINCAECGVNAIADGDFLGFSCGRGAATDLVEIGSMSMTAFNHGNSTGNNTVLRDHASGDFATANGPTRLAGLFAPVRKAGLDGLLVLVEEPTVLNSHSAAGGAQIRLARNLPDLPEHISFDAFFINESVRWCLLDVSVGKFDPIMPA